MSVVVRHGGGSHFMRPDGVMRSSIVQPMYGYQPQADMQAVAMAFTQGPPNAMNLSGPGLGGVFRRLAARIKARLNMRRANQFMFQGLGDCSPGPMMPQANQIAPQMQSQMIALQQLMQFQNTAAIRGVVAVASDELAHRRPFSFYYAG
jgi:hypothetical protein